MNVQALLIDPQQDFCSPQGSLYVKGAESDMDRVAQMVRRLSGKLADIHVTLDSHRRVDISHPMWWVDDHGKHPGPFTLMGLSGKPAKGKTRDGQEVDVARDTITGKNLITGAEATYTTFLPSMRAYSLYYLDALAKRKRYGHVVWPEHCLIGDAGHTVWPALADALHGWEDRFAVVDFVTKGSNIYTEHFSAVQAEVPDPTDPGTGLNAALVRTLEEADLVVLAGEARSHCLANSVRDIVDSFADPHTVEKLVLLLDASSDVSGFEAAGDQFVKDMVAKGMKTSTTKDFLA